MRQRVREERASRQRDGEPRGHHETPGPLFLAGGTLAAAGQGPGWTDEEGGTSGKAGHAPPAAAPQAPETGRLYARDWAAFEKWCATCRRTSLPASPDTAAAYLGLLTRRLAPGTLARHAAAPNDRHRRAGHPAPSADLGVQAVLQTRRAKAAELARMAAHFPGNLAGLRDRTLLLLAAAGLDREALLRLDWEAVCTTEEGPRMGGLSISSVPCPGALASLRQSPSRPF